MYASAQGRVILRVDLVESAPMQATRITLAADLQALGVETGRILMVHASLRRTGPVEGRADALVDALLDALGAEGTLTMVLGSHEHAGPFDPSSTPADPSVGALAEVFRQRQGAMVNDHVAARYADGIVDWPRGDYFAHVMRDWLATGPVRKARVGRAQAELFDARPFVDFAVRWMEENLLETSRLQGKNERR